MPWLAEVAPQLLSESESGGMVYTAMVSVWVASSVVTVILAVTLFRARSAGRVGPVLIGFGAPVVPAVAPIGWGIIGLGLALAARQSLRADETGVDLIERDATLQQA